LANAYLCGSSQDARRFVVYEIVALMVLIGAETFAMSLAILWSLSALMELGKGSLTASIVASAALGVGAAFWIWRRARRTAARKAQGE